MPPQPSGYPNHIKIDFANNASVSGAVDLPFPRSIAIKGFVLFIPATIDAANFKLQGAFNDILDVSDDPIWTDIVDDADTPTPIIFHSDGETPPVAVVASSAYAFAFSKFDQIRLVSQDAAGDPVAQSPAVSVYLVLLT